MRRLVLLAAIALTLAAGACTASASSKAEYGVQDDAWLQVGTTKIPLLLDRLSTLDRLGVDVVRYTLRWDHIALHRPKKPANPDDPAYDWTPADALLAGLHAHGIDVVPTLWGTPGWENGRLSSSSKAAGKPARSQPRAVWNASTRVGPGVT